MVTRQSLENFLNSLFRPELFSDYCPNGLQVEGKENIERIAFSVSATVDSVSQAVEKKADALIVHHGLFWKFHGARSITGPFSKRVKPLVQNEINLFGHHLPLDANEEVGNAKSLADLLELQDLRPFGEYKGAPLGMKGRFLKPINAIELQKKLKALLNREVWHACPQSSQEIHNLGIITGGANSEWTFCLDEGLEAYLTGEMSEHDWHESQEAGIHMYAGGHHATEKFGIQSLQKLLEKNFEIETFFIDSNNPA